MNSTLAPTMSARSALLVLTCLLLAIPRAGAADANPPNLMTYQGYLVDGNGAPLGNTNPRNYDTVFRIYDASQAGTLVWAEQQTVTVDKGHFSVLLGEGSQVGSEPRGSLSSVFNGTSASDRFIGITVKGLGGTDVEIAPRLRLLPTPYAFLARNAGGLVNNNGAQLVSVATGTLTVNAPLQVTGALSATSLAGTGVNITQINAANISAGTLAAARVPDLNGNKITAGTVADARLSANIPRLNAENTFTAKMTATEFAGNGTIPVGGIIMWSGTTVPAGWALCNGQTVNGRVTPDLRGRFITGAGSGITHAGATGTAANLAAGLPNNAVGANAVRETVSLAVGHLPSHSHTYKDGVYAESSGVGSWSTPGSGFYKENVSSGIGSGDHDTDNNALRTRNLDTGSTGTGTAFSIRPSHYALAYIMRVQ